MEIPGLRGLTVKELGKRSVKQFLNDDMTTYAAALSYHALLALFPFIIFLLALLGALRIPGFFDWVLNQAQTTLPSDAYQRVEQVINHVRGQARGGLLSFGILFAIWAASAAVRSLMNALNAAYDAAEDRPAWKRYPLSIGFTIGLAVMLIVAAALMLLGPQAVKWIAGQAGLSGFVVSLWTWLRWPVAIVLLLVAVAVVLYVAPNIDQPFRLITPGSALAVAAWVVATLGFSFYVSNFGNYNATYGSLGGVVVLLLYFFISSATLLFGAEVNAVIYKARQGAPSGERRRQERTKPSRKR